MRINRNDLTLAYDAVVFMNCIEGRSYDWKQLAVLVHESMQRRAGGEEGSFSTDCSHDIAVELAPHGAEIHRAMREHWMAWAKLGREVAKNRGWISALHREEFGTAQRVAVDIREASQFLCQAIETLAPLTAH